MNLNRHELMQVVNMYLPLVEEKLEMNIIPKETETERKALVTINEKSFSFAVPKEEDSKKQWKHFSKNAVYQALEQYTGKSLEWGSHTGVRPVSLVHRLGQDDVERILEYEYHFSRSKRELVMKIANLQKPLLSADPMAIDIYIGIPFCRTRCTYCSFSLVGIEKKGKLQKPYTACLCREIEEVGRSVLSKGYHPRCIYIGGGTPTALEDTYLQKLLDTVNGVFPQRLELTLEAGRPDTITRSNLMIAKEAGVTRISINPQTIHQKTLDKIGRQHSMEDVERAFALAREVGFDSINMDLIAGLPGETVEDFRQSLLWAKQMDPESITVHTFALKRSSALKKQEYKISGDRSVRSMLDFAYENLEEHYQPYYLYRQKYMEDNGENVGFSKAGHECLYNIDIMEENTHILAMGSGGISKKIVADGLVRRSDPKDVEVYIERISSTIGKNISFF